MPNDGLSNCVSVSLASSQLFSEWWLVAALLKFTKLNEFFEPDVLRVASMEVRALEPLPAVAAPITVCKDPSTCSDCRSTQGHTTNKRLPISPDSVIAIYSKLMMIRIAFSRRPTQALVDAVVRRRDAE